MQLYCTAIAHYLCTVGERTVAESGGSGREQVVLRAGRQVLHEVVAGVGDQLRLVREPAVDARGGGRVVALDAAHAHTALRARVRVLSCARVAPKQWHGMCYGIRGRCD